jgi:ABC-2 type transport system ATP-binding protein
MSTLVALEHVSKSYGDRPALRGLSLTVKEGDALGLLGPNGAGKSTTMSLITGLLEPDAGTVRLFGDQRPGDRATRARIGFAPQSLSLYPVLTAEENLTFFARMNGCSGERLRDAVERGLRLAGLVERRRDRVATFSGGMQRRLNLACAVVHGPKLLLLDEPTVGVDPQSRAHLFECLKTLRAEGLTMIYSTHYMEEAETLCNRVAIVDQGRVLAEGTVKELVARHGGTERVVSVGPNLETVFLNLTGRSLRD